MTKSDLTRKYSCVTARGVPPAPLPLGSAVRAKQFQKNVQKNSGVASPVRHPCPLDLELGDPPDLELGDPPASDLTSD